MIMKSPPLKNAVKTADGANHNTVGANQNPLADDERRLVGGR
jgi:hypothetical protein